jgi:hypothetical protein
MFIINKSLTLGRLKTFCVLASLTGFLGRGLRFDVINERFEYFIHTTPVTGVGAVLVMLGY